MADTSADLNGVRVLRVRLVTCSRGPWFADLDLDPSSDPVSLADVPSGQAVLTISPTGLAPIVLRGTIEADAAGRFVSSVPVRLVAGGGGWSGVVPAEHFHSDGGISSVTVEQATAAVIGETVVDASPVSLGLDWDRLEGPARRVFGDRDWYVDAAGVTQVASRPTATPDASVQLLEWHPIEQHGIVAADALVLPGTVLTDPRFDGPITVRDVSQTFTPQGSRAEVWCGGVAGGRLLPLLTNLVRELGGVQNLKTFAYRIVSQGSDGRLTLQPVPNPDGSPSDAPILDPVSVWPGMAGLSAEYALSSQVLVTLVGGNPGLPVVVGFDGGPGSTLPLSVTLDATGTVHVGPGAKIVELAGGTVPVAGEGCVVACVFPSGTMITGVVTSPALNPQPPFTAPFTGTMTMPGVIMGTIQNGLTKVTGK